MSQIAASDFVSDGRPAVKLRVAALLGTIIFSVVVGLLVLTAIPYGTAEAWWKAFVVCVVLSLTIVWLVEGYLSGRWIEDGWSVVLPILVLVVFSFLQTISIGGANAPGGLNGVSNSLSVDPYQTRFFAMQLVALTLVGVLLFRFATSQRRMRILIHVIIAVSVASAIFGVLRQTTQRSLGFGLPLLQMIGGYGQFINRNHFAYLMEMAFGLTLGLIIARGVKREHLLIYVAALLPLWTALVLCGSRGGLFAMMAQVVAALLLFDMVVRSRDDDGSTARILLLARSLPVRLALLFVLLGVVGFGTLWLGGDPLAARIEEARTDLNAGTSESRLGVSRNEIWRASWGMFAAHPILGVGMGAYWAAVPAYHNASGAMTPQEAHNDYLELLASGGLVGFGIAAWFAFAVFKRTRGNLKSSNQFRRAAAFGATIGIVGVAVHSLVDFGLHMMVNALVFTTLVVIATSKPRWANRSTAETS